MDEKIEISFYPEGGSSGGTIFFTFEDREAGFKSILFLEKLKSNMSTRKQRGFTLLEVIVALAISGFILGGLFSLLGSSKQLSWTSEENLLRAARIRAATNFYCKTSIETLRKFSSTIPLKFVL